MTTDDRDAVVRLTPGQHLEVVLDQQYWTRPAASSPALRDDGATGSPAAGWTARFTAVDVAVVDVRATTDPPCRHSTPACMLATRDFSVRVEITG